MTVADRLREFIVASYLPHESPASLRDDTPLITGGILDEAGARDLVLFIGREFCVSIGPEAIVASDSIGKLARYVEWVAADGEESSEPWPIGHEALHREGQRDGTADQRCS